MLRSVGGYLAGKVSRVKHGVQILWEGGSKWMVPNLLAALNGDLFHPVSGCAPMPPPLPPTDDPFLSKHHVLSPAIHFLRRHYMRNAREDSEKQLAELQLRIVILRRYMAESTCQDITNDPRLDWETLPLITKHDVSECTTKYISVLRYVDMCETRYKLLILLVLGDYIELSASPPKLVEILTLQNVFLKLESLNLTFLVERVLMYSFQLVSNGDGRVGTGVDSFLLQGRGVCSFWRLQYLCTDVTVGTPIEYINLCSEYRPSSSEVSKNKLLLKLQNEAYNAMNSSYTRGLNGVFFGL